MTCDEFMQLPAATVEMVSGPTGAPMGTETFTVAA